MWLNILYMMHGILGSACTNYIKEVHRRNPNSSLKYNQTNWWVSKRDQLMNWITYGLNPDIRSEASC